MRKKFISLTNQQWRQRLQYSSLVLLLLLFSVNLFSQNLLIVDHPKKRLRLRFHEKDQISVITKDGVYTSGVISAVEDSALVIGKHKISLVDMEFIIVQRRLLSLASSALKTAAVAYIGLDIFNAVTNGDRPIISTYTIVGPVVVFAAGLAVGLLSRSKYGPPKGHRLRIIDTSP